MTNSLVGIILGFVISFPFGPVGIYMINRAQKYGFWQGFSIGLIDAFVEALFCLLSLLGMSLIIHAPMLNFTVQLTGLLVLLYLGCQHFFPDRISLYEEKIKSRLKNIRVNVFTFSAKDTIIITIFAFSNPLRLAFWVNAATLIHTLILKHGDFFEYLIFSLSIGLGSALCQYVILRFMQKTHCTNNNYKTVTYWLGSIIFIVAFIYFGIHTFEGLETLKLK